MAESPEIPNPTTSYSDPIYDRLETVAQRIIRRLGLVILAMAVIVAVAVVSHQAMKNNPTAASAHEFLTAFTNKQEAEQARNPVEKNAGLDAAQKELTAVATNEAITPYYRARAYVELTQIALNRSQLTEASAAVEQAKTFASKSENADLELAVGLSEAAVFLQKGEHAAAENLYRSVERAAGQNNPDRQMAAAIGAAKAMELQGNLEGAIAILEGPINRVDKNASMLIELAKNTYWALKRKQATPAPAVNSNPQPETPIAPTPGATETAPAPAPATPASPTTTPETTPATPAPTAPTNPEGK